MYNNVKTAAYRESTIIRSHGRRASGGDEQQDDVPDSKRIGILRRERSSEHQQQKPEFCDDGRPLKKADTVRGPVIYLRNVNH